MPLSTLSDHLTQLPYDSTYEAVHKLRAMLPLPIEETPEGYARRDRAAINQLRQMVLASADETELGIKYIAAGEQEADCMRQLCRTTDAKLRHQLVAQAACMGREARGYRALLLRVQAVRTKREATEAGAFQADAIEEGTLELMLEALARPPRTGSAAPSVWQAPAAQADPVVTVAAEPAPAEPQPPMDEAAAMLRETAALPAGVPSPETAARPSPAAAPPAESMATPPAAPSAAPSAALSADASRQPATAPSAEASPQPAIAAPSAGSPPPAATIAVPAAPPRALFTRPMTLPPRPAPVAPASRRRSRGQPAEDDWPRPDWAAEAERYAIMYPRRAQLIRRVGGVPRDCSFGPPEPPLVRAILRGTSPALLALDDPGCVVT